MVKELMEQDELHVISESVRLGGKVAPCLAL